MTNRTSLRRISRSSVLLAVVVLVVACSIAAVGVSAIVRTQGASTRVEETAS